MPLQFETAGVATGGRGHRASRDKGQDKNPDS
jgi:hypothetical protein